MTSKRLDERQKMFEQLAKMEKEIVAPQKSYSDFCDLKMAGVYIFWIHKTDLPIELNTQIQITGPKKEIIPVRLDWNFDKEWIPVYIGKTTNLKTRIQNHLKMKTPSSRYQIAESSLKIKLTTSDQLRAGLEHLLYHQNVLDFIKTKVFMSFIPIENMAIRFYFEDYLIGKYCPWFNLDSER